MSKLGVVGSTVAQQILLLVISTFGAGKERVLWFLLCSIMLAHNWPIAIINLHPQIFLITFLRDNHGEMCHPNVF